VKTSIQKNGSAELMSSEVEREMSIRRKKIKREIRLV
jgi:hypothetical protein